MAHNEQKAVFSLSVIMACRMLGLFLILPIFSLYASHLKDATPSLMGLALGIYGFTQACLQIPMGSLSDRIGRKPVIATGLIVFAIGSIIAALSTSIYGIIIGRAIQGAGAIGSTTLALLSDLTRDENRSKAMATIGLAIGTSFMIAMILGPALNHWVGLSGIFWTILALSLLSLGLVCTVLPRQPKLFCNPNTAYQANQSSAVLKNTQLLRLDLGVCTIHAMLTASFIGIPIILTRLLNLSQFDQVLLYVIVLPVAFFLMLPFIIIGEKKRKLKPFLTAAACLLILTQITLSLFHNHLSIVALALLVFFGAFTFLEATLPSLVSKISPIQRKGTAMGIYSTSQFLGIFIGGSLGGIIFSHFQLTGLFIFSALLGLIWLFSTLSMRQPPYFATIILEANNSVFINFQQIQQKLLAISGIAEITGLAQEGLLYIKADKEIINKEQLRKLIDEGNLHQ